MSRKRKRYRSKNGTKRTVPTGPQSNLPALLSAFDGYSNAAAFLGEDSPLLSSGTFRRSELTRQTELLTTAYRENWIVKRIIDMPCEDMTRAWYRLSTYMPESDLKALKQLEAKHSVKQELANAIRMARLYGGSLALIVIRGDEQRLDLPLDPDVLLPGCFKGLLVLDKTQGVEPSLDLVRDSSAAGGEACIVAGFHPGGNVCRDARSLRRRQCRRHVRRHFRPGGCRQSRC